MTPQTRTGRAASYDASVEIGPRHRRIRWPNPSEIASALALATTLLLALGWKYAPASRAIEAETIARVTADSMMRRDIEHNARRIDTLSVQQTFTNFLLCDARRGLQGSETARERCEDIIAKWGQRP